MAATKIASDYVPNPGYSQADWDAVTDNPEWTADDFRTARPFAEAFPTLGENLRQSRGSEKERVKVPVTIRLDAAIIDAFKATGEGWQTRMNDVLRDAAAKLGPLETKG
jgi:uncharacterized protein (DUF4415 family)